MPNKKQLLLVVGEVTPDQLGEALKHMPHPEPTGRLWEVFRLTLDEWMVTITDDLLSDLEAAYARAAGFHDHPQLYAHEDIRALRAAFYQAAKGSRLLFPLDVVLQRSLEQKSQSLRSLGTNGTTVHYVVNAIVEYNFANETTEVIGVVLPAPGSFDPHMRTRVAQMNQIWCGALELPGWLTATQGRVLV